MKKILLPFLIFIVIGAVTIYYFTKGNNGNPNLLVMAGTIEAVEINLAFKAGGKLEYIKYDEGDSIIQGDTIAELSHSETLARIRQADDQINASLAQLKLAQIDLRNTERNLERVENLIPVGGATTAQKDDLQDKKLASQATIEATNAAIAAARSQYDYLNVLYDNEFLVAPINCSVLIRPVEGGEVLNPGQTVLTVADLNRLQIKVYLPEINLGNVKNGQDVSIAIDSYAKKSFTGKITKISDKAEFTPKNIQTKDERVKTVYAVTVSTGNYDGVFKPGMPCDVTLNLAK